MRPGLFEAGDGDGCGGYGDVGDAPCERVADGCCLAAERTILASGGSYGVIEMKKSCNLLSKDEETHCYLKSSHLNLSFNHGLELESWSSSSCRWHLLREFKEAEVRYCCWILLRSNLFSRCDSKSLKR